MVNELLFKQKLIEREKKAQLVFLGKVIKENYIKLFFLIFPALFSFRGRIRFFLFLKNILFIEKEFYNLKNPNSSPLIFSRENEFETLVF